MPISKPFGVFKSLFLLSTFSPFFASSLPFRNWHCVRAQVSPDTQSSGWHKVYEDYYDIWACWPSKETFRHWWCLLVLVGGGKSFTLHQSFAGILCKSWKRIGSVSICNCTFIHQVFIANHTVKRGSMICWKAY